MNNKKVAEQLLKMAKSLMAVLNIGPFVKLEGKRGLYKVVRKNELRNDSGHGFNSMMDAGYTHFVVLESPRGKELEFYVRDGGRDGKLHWYKNHRTLVPMKFENVEPFEVYDYQVRVKNTYQKYIINAAGEYHNLLFELEQKGIIDRKTMSKASSKMFRSAEAMREVVDEVLMKIK